jgi:hypothetical protein
MDSFFQKIYSLTSKIRQRQILHILFGATVSGLVNCLLSLAGLDYWWLRIILTASVLIWAGDAWEKWQVSLGANYDVWDVFDGVCGGLVVCLLIFVF